MVIGELPRPLLAKFDKTVSQFCEAMVQVQLNNGDVDNITKAVEKVAIDPNDPRAAKAARRTANRTQESSKSRKSQGPKCW